MSSINREENRSEELPLQLLIDPLCLRAVRMSLIHHGPLLPAPPRTDPNEARAHSTAQRLSFSLSRSLCVFATTRAQLVLQGTNAALNTHTLSKLLTAATTNQQTHKSLLLMEHNHEMTDGGTEERSHILLVVLLNSMFCTGGKTLAAFRHF